MTTEEIKKALGICTDIYHSCDDCPYQEQDIRNCSDTLKDDARELIIEQEREIERLKEVIKNYKEVLCETTQRKDDAIKLNDKLIDEYEIKVKQAKIKVLNELYHRFTACPYQLDINEVQKEIKKFITEIEK